MTDYLVVKHDAFRLNLPIEVNKIKGILCFLCKKNEIKQRIKYIYVYHLPVLYIFKRTIILLPKCRFHIVHYVDIFFE